MLKYVERSLDSLKSRWTQKILPAVNKFQGICETNPLTSGELKDDVTMDRYYGIMHDIYVGTQFVTIPNSILDAVFLPVSKLERFCSQIITNHLFVCWRQLAISTELSN